MGCRDLNLKILDQNTPPPSSRIIWLMYFIITLIALYFLIGLVLKYSKIWSRKSRVSIQNRKNSKITQNRYKELSESGYFDYADDNKLDIKAAYKWLSPGNEAMGDMLDDPNRPDDKLSDLSITHRSYFADGEELAEGGIEKIIDELVILKIMKNLKMPEITEDYPTDDDSSYRIHVDGNTYTAWNPEHGEDGTLWGTATVCFSAIVNDILENSGYDERVYMLFAGNNEAIALVITPAQYDILQKCGKEPAQTEEEMSELLDFNPRS